jgi:hypothetical protein
MITTAAIAILAPVLNPFEPAAAPPATCPLAAGPLAAGIEEAAAFGALEAAGGFVGTPWTGAPAVGVPHLPQNLTVSLTLVPQFLQNVLMVISVNSKDSPQMRLSGENATKMTERPRRVKETSSKALLNP